MERHRLRSILTELGISSQDQRKAVNICCPFCRGSTRGLPDDRFRLGIFPDTLRYHCFRCSRVGGLYEVLHKVAGIDEAEFRRLVGHRPIGESDRSLTDRVRAKLAESDELTEPMDSCPPPSLPAGIPISEAAKQYIEVERFLFMRHLNERTCDLYGAVYTGRSGPHAYRMVWPIPAEDGTLAAWQGRDLTGRLKAKYYSEGPIGSLLYWTKRLNPMERVYVVEGVLDCWRMGDNAVATFSNRMSLRQQSLLLFHRPPLAEVVIAWDWDSWTRAKQAARQLAPLLRAGAVRLPEGADPDSLGGGAVRKLEVWWA